MTLGYSLQANRKTREGSRAPGPQRAVRAHQRAACAALPAARPAGDLGGHQEEGIGRRLQERRAGVAARGRARAGARARLPGHASWARPSRTASTTCARNEGWVSVGIDHDTAAFAVRIDPPLVDDDGPRSAIREATALLITADGGGSNGYRVPAVEAGAAAAGRRDWA